MLNIENHPMKNRFLSSAALIAALVLPVPANAHPHVFVEANLEIVRDDQGNITELRHVWRFDELFSTTVVLDFDANANDMLEPDELDEVSKTVTQSVGQENFFTEIRLGNQDVEFLAPEKINVDYKDGQLLMFFATRLKAPVKPGDGDFKVSVSDPTYYVAMDIADDNAVMISGNASGCSSLVQRPDYDKLMSQAATTEDFFNNPSGAGLGDAWMTWVTLKCA
jgi:ABC-type uncharacterized transport system substrate-binding protein